MRFDRRNFIKFTAGGVMGIHLTPIPFKLMDDVAIWTQNWPWVPVPPEGEFTHVKSVCTLCPGACGIQVRKVDERAVKIEGRTDYPVNPGGICPTGMGGLQLLYNNSIRYPGPMRRVGPRGSGKFIDVSWKEALNELNVRISYLRKAGRPDSLVSIDGNVKGSSMSAMIERLTRAIGSPNYVRMPSLDDTYSIGTRLLHGKDGSMAYDLENADFILSFGSGLLEGWGAPGRIMNAWSVLRDNAIEGKSTFVQIESRASNTASKADKWVAAKPGTDAALALGLAHVIIKNRYYDSKFVDNDPSGFNKFKAMVLDRYSPEKVSEITAVPKDVIINLARDFAQAKAPLAIYGKGKGSLNGGLYEFMAVHSLNALVGNIGQPGGVLLLDPIPLSPLPELKPDAIATKSLEKTRLDQAGSLRFPFAGSLVHNLFESISKSHESPVDTLLIFSANPLYTLPGTGTVKEALKKIPFVVSFSPFQDETSYMADLILPDHSYLEKTDDIVYPPGLQYPLYGLSKPVVEPIFDTRNTGDVIIQLAKKLGQSVGPVFPWRNYEEVLKLRAEGLFKAGGGLVKYEGSEPAWTWQKKGAKPNFEYSSFDEMWDEIKSEGLWYLPVGTSEKLGIETTSTTKLFNFFSTRIEQAVMSYAEHTSESEALKNMGIHADGEEAYLPHYEAMHTPSRRSSFPLKMLPYDMMNMASGWVPNPPFLYKTILDDQLLGSESFAEINPKTASEYDLKQGDRAIIESPGGEVQVRMNLSDGAMPGIVYLPMGFGHTAYDEFSREKGVNPNDIIQVRKDSLSGHPVWWDTPVQLVKV